MLGKLEKTISGVKLHAYGMSVNPPAISPTFLIASLLFMTLVFFNKL
jgi:hypothetical protein